MPDADDFDVEYFRDLLKGNDAKAERQTPAVAPPPPAKRKTRTAAGKGAAPKQPGRQARAKQSRNR